MRIYLCALALLCALYYATGACASPEMPFRDVNLKKTLKHPVESVESVVGNEHKRHKQNVLQAAQKVQDALHSNMQQLKANRVGGKTNNDARERLNKDLHNKAADIVQGNKANKNRDMETKKMHAMVANGADLSEVGPRPSKAQRRRGVQNQEKNQVTQKQKMHAKAARAPELTAVEPPPAMLHKFKDFQQRFAPARALLYYGSYPPPSDSYPLPSDSYAPPSDFSFPPPSDSYPLPYDSYPPPYDSYPLPSDFSLPSDFPSFSMDFSSYSYGSCDEYNPCGECQYCDSSLLCYPADACGVYGDPLNGACPSMSGSETCNDIVYSDYAFSFEAQCNVTSDCGDGEYCDFYGNCWDECSCPYYEDAAEGVCPDLTNNDCTEYSWYSYYPTYTDSNYVDNSYGDYSVDSNPWVEDACLSHDSCEADNYCDLYGSCWDCCSCAYFADAFDGDACPECDQECTDFSSEYSVWSSFDDSSLSYWFPSMNSDWEAYWEYYNYYDSSIYSSCWWCSDPDWSSYSSWSSWYSYGSSDFWGDYYSWSFTYEDQTQCYANYVDTVSDAECAYENYFSEYSFTSSESWNWGYYECQEHSDCHPTEYCDDKTTCFNCCDCHLFDDAITGSCPECAQDCATVDYDWSTFGNNSSYSDSPAGSCERHSDCKTTGEYCSDSGFCYSRCICEHFMDAFDNECPPFESADCADYSTSDYYMIDTPSSYGYGECTSSRDCNGEKYCWKPLEWKFENEDSSAYTVEISSEQGFCDSCCYCEWYVADLDLMGVEHDVICPVDCSDDCDWLSYYTGCSAHEECGDDQYCTEHNYCDQSCSCLTHDDSITGECPDTCDATCATNNDCEGSAYCTNSGVCEECCLCTSTVESYNWHMAYYTDGSSSFSESLQSWYDHWLTDAFGPIDGTCDCACEWDYYESYDFSSAGECESHSDCGGSDEDNDRYCDAWNYCDDCCNCQYWADPVDGACPECSEECVSYDYNYGFGFDLDGFCDGDCSSTMASAEIAYYQCLGLDSYAQEMELYANFMCVANLEGDYCMNELEEIVYTVDLSWYSALTSYDFTNWAVDGAECAYFFDINCCGPTMVQIMDELAAFHEDEHLDLQVDFLEGALAHCGLADVELCVMGGEQLSLLQTSWAVNCFSPGFFESCFKESSCRAAMELALGEDIVDSTGIPLDHIFIEPPSSFANKQGVYINFYVHGADTEQTQAYQETLSTTVPTFAMTSAFVGQAGLVWNCAVGELSHVVTSIDIAGLDLATFDQYQLQVLTAAIEQVMTTYDAEVDMAVTAMSNTDAGISMQLRLSSDDSVVLQQILDDLTDVSFSTTLSLAVANQAASQNVAFAIPVEDIQVETVGVNDVSIDPDATVVLETVVEGVEVEVLSDYFFDDSDYYSGENDTTYLFTTAAANVQCSVYVMAVLSSLLYVLF